MAGGRPSDYSDSVIPRTKKYLVSCKDGYPKYHKGIPISLYAIEVKLPTIEGLAVHLGVSRDTIYEWEGIHPEFSDILGQLRAEQANRLINSGLSGSYNPTIAKVLLTKHGYREGIEQTGKDGQPLFNDETRTKANSAIDALTEGDAKQGE